MSEERSRTAHTVEDLSILSRRGVLSAADQRALNDVLVSNTILAIAHEVGCDFDHIAVVRPGDTVFIAECATRCVAQRLEPARKRRPQMRAFILVAAIAVSGSAAAWCVHSGALRQHDPPQPLATPLARSVASARGLAVPAVTASPTLTLQPAPTQSATASDTPRVKSNPSSDADAHLLDSAEALFREASVSRRTGDWAIARALYLRLEHDFPQSDEAQLAHVSLGNLLLSMGRAGEAEQQFASYPAGGGSTLVQEALVGRARSLAALGRSAEEGSVWADLLHGYPNGVYAAQAARRLAELQRP